METNKHSWHVVHMTSVFGGNEFGLISAHFLFISFNKNLGRVACSDTEIFRRQFQHYFSTLNMKNTPENLYNDGVFL